MYIQKSGSDLGSDHTFYTIYGIQPADHPLHGGLVVDIKIYVAGKYSFIGTQIDLAHIHSHDQRDVAGDLVQQTDPVNSLDGEAHRKRLAVIILPLEAMLSATGHDFLCTVTVPSGDLMPMTGSPGIGRQQDAMT